MTNKKQSNPMIANAIVWAALMIATALIMADAEGRQKEFIMLMQFTGWFAINLSLVKGGNSFKSEWACLRRRFGKSEQG